MNKKLLKKSGIILSSIALLVSISTSVLIACGGWEIEDIFSSFFAPEVSNAKVYKPFFSTVHTFYDGEYGYSKDDNISDFREVNVEEWSNFFKNKVTKEDLSYLLYESNLGEVDTLIFHLKNNKYPIRAFLKKNSLLAFQDKTAAREFLYYLGFAKRCEEYAAVPYSWEEEPEIKSKPATDLIKGAMKLVKNVKNNFIRQRYYFQLVRLYFFDNSFYECYNYYNQHADSFTVDNSIRWRAMGYAAGAKYRLNDFGTSNYMYAKIYDGCNQMKETAYLSFEPKEEKDWQKSLSLSKNDREKAAVWHLLGIKVDGLRAMKEIYALDPHSDLLDLLLVRSINGTESDVLPLGYSDNEYKIRNEKVDAKLFQFIESVAQKENSLKPYLWNMATAYLLTLSGEYKKSEKYLSKAEKQIVSDLLAKEQIKLIRIIANIEEFKPSAKAEAAIVKDLLWLKDNNQHTAASRYQTVYSWALNRLSEKYQSSGDLIKAIYLNSYPSKRYAEDNNKLDQLIAYNIKKDKSEFDQFLIAIFPFKKEDLYDMQGVNLLYKNKNLEAALEKFRLGNNETLLGDPFHIRINDCHDCDHEENKTSINKVAFIEKLIALEKKVQQEPEDAFNHYFNLANGYYNMSYFGNARIMYFTSLYDPGIISFNYNRDELSEYQHLLDCSKAEEYYSKALNATTNKELKAKATFMAAKCEQNKLYITNPKIYEGDFKAGKYFKTLKNEYASTKYYKEIINECGYFKTYLLSHKKK